MAGCPARPGRGSTDGGRAHIAFGSSGQSGTVKRNCFSRVRGAHDRARGAVKTMRRVVALAGAVGLAVVVAYPVLLDLVTGT